MGEHGGTAGLAVRAAAIGASMLVALGLLLGQAVQTEAQEAGHWEALGPAGQGVGRLYTPASGALLANTQAGLVRSDDAGESWQTILKPDGAIAMAVSPADDSVLYATSSQWVLRSQDGGATWEHMADQGGPWTRLEISPADPDVLYATAVTNPPADYGTNRWVELWVSRDAGRSWENVRTQHERILPGTSPCLYTLNLLLPHSLSTTRVLTIEGCNGRGMDPLAGWSKDEGRTVEIIPTARSASWSANDAVGGGGTHPERWYVSLFKPGIAYTRIRHSRIVRSDDDGLTWTTVFESDGGEPDKKMAKPMDFATALTYDPQHPDRVFGIFAHYEPNEQAFKEHRRTGSTLRMSDDGGVTWTDLSKPDERSIGSMLVSVDGRYLFAGTDNGVYRLALPQ